MFGHMVTPEPSEFHLRHELFTDKARSSLTRFAEVMARRKAVLTESHLSSACNKGSTGGEHRASSTKGRSHVGALGMFGGRSLSAPLKKRDTSLWLPTVLLSTLEC